MTVSGRTRKRIRRGLTCTVVGMNEIKRRRLEELEVHCHPNTNVGQYVPFYFCPRSVMLYLLHRGNSQGLAYHGGQREIVHLQADLNTVIAWLSGSGYRMGIQQGQCRCVLYAFLPRAGPTRPVELGCDLPD